MTMCLPQLTLNFPESSSPLLSIGALIKHNRTLHQAHGGTISMTSESYVTTRKWATHATRLHVGVNAPQWPSTELLISSKRQQKYRTVFWRNSKGKIQKDPCLSHHENHRLKSFWCFTPFKITSMKMITFEPDPRTTVALISFMLYNSLTHVVFSSYGSSFVTFPVCKVTYKIMFT